MRLRLACTRGTGVPVTAPALRAVGLGKRYRLAPRERYQTLRDTLEATPAEPDAQLVEEAVAYYQSAARALKQGRLHSAYHQGEK